MAAKKRKWSADPASIYKVMGRNQAFTELEQGHVVTPVRMALERMRLGTATDTDFHTLAAACNIAVVCAEQINPEVSAVCALAVAALVRCRERFSRSNVWGFDGPAFAEVGDVVGLYEQLVALLKPGQLQDAMAEAIRRSKFN